MVDGEKMVDIFDLTEEDGERFVNYFEIVPPMTGACLMANIKAISNVLTQKARPLGSDIRYLKLHHYIFVSSLVDTLAVIASNEFDVERNIEFKTVIDDVKLNMALSSFNNVPVLPTLPSYEPMHGQDILLFRAIENESLNGQISFFDYKELIKQFGGVILNAFQGEDETEQNELRTEIYELFGRILSDKTRLYNIDLSFNKLQTDASSATDKKIINDLVNFMGELPSTVYHCHDGETIYSGRGFSISCPCGQTHAIDSCEAICDGGSAHFAVFRSACKKAIVKVVSEGMFRIKGVKVISQISADRTSLIDVASEAISSRKRID